MAAAAPAPTSLSKGQEEESMKIMDPRVLVIASLFLQFVLIVAGNRRKYIKNKLVRLILWLSYLSADYIATLALGVLSRAEADSKAKYTITAFWAPFLLMHLGGPDTITAYAMADNELWLRHFLGLLGQAAVVGYVFYRSFTHARLNYLSLVIVLAGVVKYGERSWVLFSSSKDQYRDSLVSEPDPGPNYAKFMDELVSREKEGYKVSLDKAVDNISSSSLVDTEANGDRRIGDAFLLQKAFSLYGTFKKLFADLILSYQDREMSVSFFEDLQWEDAFTTVEIELGLIFDLFYTKSPLVFSKIGFYLRILSCLSTTTALVAFPTINKNDHAKVDGVVKKNVVYPEVEVIITYILLGGAFLLELYAILIISLSDRMMVRRESDLTTRPQAELPKFISHLYCLRAVPARKRWSNSVGQYNVFKHCFKYMPNRPGVCRCPKKLDQLIEKYLRSRNKPVPDDLKQLIFDQLKERAKSGHNKKHWKDKILLEEIKCFNNNDEVEFDQSLVIWHMATDICYTNDEQPGLEEDEKRKRERCKLLSDYMVHLLIMSPFMLPSGIGHIRFQDTTAEVTEFFKYEEELDLKNAWKTLSKVDDRYIPSDVKGDKSKSLFFDAQRVAKALNRIEDASERWDKITQAWVDILTFAAAQCGWSDHAEKLSQGGELLTHVWLLMAHFGMTDQFQISRGFIRPKLVLK